MLNWSIISFLLLVMRATMFHHWQSTGGSMLIDNVYQVEGVALLVNPTNVAGITQNDFLILKVSKNQIISILYWISKWTKRMLRWKNLQHKFSWMLLFWRSKSNWNVCRRILMLCYQSYSWLMMIFVSR